MCNASVVIQALINQLGNGLSKVRFPGKWRVANSMGMVFSLLCAEAYCFPHAKAKIAIRLKDRAERMMWAGCYEPELIAIMKSLLEPDMVFVDIGAHIGFFTVLAGSLIAECGEVYAFEPDPDCFQRLVLNTKNDDRFHVYPMAISDTIGKITFFRSCLDSESGWGTIMTVEEPRTEIHVSVGTLDSWSLEKNVKRIDFVKIDVEGAEYRVLRGAKTAIEKYRPILFLEINKVCLARDCKSSNDILAFLGNCAYFVQGSFNLKSHALEALLAIPEYRFDLKDRIANLPGLNLEPIYAKKN